MMEVKVGINFPQIISIMCGQWNLMQALLFLKTQTVEIR